MANVQTRLSGQRAELGPKLPLNMPYVLIVDPSSLCNLRCKWCPSGHDDLISAAGRKQCVMDYDLFCDMIDSLDEFEEPVNVLRLYKEGEPLVNPRYSDMIFYAKKSKHVKRIDTTTNGLLLTPELNRNIIEAGLDQINISVNGVSEKQIFENTGRKLDFEKYVDNIRDLYEHRGTCTVYVKSIKNILTEEEQNLFFEIFGKIADRVYLEQLSPAWPMFELEDYGLSYDNIGNYGQPVEDRMVCPYLFYIIVINADGSVSTCVQDWKHVQIVGNIKDESIRSIWLGDKQKKIQMCHLKGIKDSYPMCHECKVITHGCYDNIDQYATEIMKRMLS